ncbi:Metallo-dependent phosphatase-like protein, partial [Baffinella frigidus]
VAYLLNGDIADRGDNSVEIFVVVLVYKLLHPNRVFINRGNHENHDINRKPAEYGGGFYDEVMYKMDGSVFLMFQQFFETLPLVSVIEKQVCVLHGGIPRKEGVLLKHIEAIQRRRQCPKVVQTADDAILFDLMWADPQDQRGIALAAQRGPNCRKFGPDVTKRFLSDNALSLCIRSHEVPISLRGFEERHDGRLLTVFSASNYCGQAGNYGAVVVFDSDMSYTLEEHMAPDLDSMIAEYIESLPASAKGSAAGAMARVTSWKSGQNAQVDLEKSREQMQADVMAKLEVKICQHKDGLWWYWKNEDHENTGMISAAKWREGMTSQLNLDVPWFSLQKELANPDDNGNVNYHAFLERVRNSAMSEGLKNTTAGWEKLMVVKLYESILRCDMTLKQTLTEFDPDGDGVVSPWEFKQALRNANVDIPDQQLNAIMRTMDLQDDKLDVASFLDRFQVVYSRAADQGLSSIETEEHRRIKGLLSKVGTGLLAGKSRVEVFEKMDINKDGFISREEFYEACNQLAHEVSGEDRTAMWNYVDANGDGHLNYFEFCAAFQVVDMSDGEGGAVTEIVEVIVSALQKNMSSLEFAFRFFDQKGVGNVSVDDFKAGLRALNSAVTAGPPLTDAQLDVLVEFVDQVPSLSP